jgi:hypothetical protein
MASIPYPYTHKRLGLRHVDNVYRLHTDLLFCGYMTTTQKREPDYRKERYKSVRLSKRVHKKLAARAKKESRTMSGVIDNLLD